MNEAQVLPIIGRVRHYSWGKYGPESLVYQLADESERRADKPHAELWFGTHPSAPARIRQAIVGTDAVGPDVGSGVGTDQSSGRKLSQTLNETISLPFLLKVLSISTPLSIQLHPNALLAEKLHIQDPEHYPDADAKPEMVYALTSFHALHGFRSPQDILREAECNPIIKELTSFPGGCSKADLVKNVFERICAFDEKQIAKYCARLHQVYQQAADFDDRARWFLKLSEATEKNSPFSSSDRGLLFYLLLALKELLPGEVLVTLPGVVHAYLDGDVIECMATSDNVIRLGLTEKFVDLPSAKLAVDFASAVEPASAQKIVSTGVTDFSFSGGRDYHLSIISVDNGVRTPPREAIKLPNNERDCLLLSIDAHGQMDIEKGGVFNIRPGSAAYLPASRGPYLLRLSRGLLVIAS